MKEFPPPSLAHALKVVSTKKKLYENFLPSTSYNYSHSSKGSKWSLSCIIWFILECLPPVHEGKIGYKVVKNMFFIHLISIVLPKPFHLDSCLKCKAFIHESLGLILRTPIFNTLKNHNLFIQCVKIAFLYNLKSSFDSNKN